MGVRQFIRPDIAASAIAHLSVLGLVILFTEVRPFGSVTAEPIAVDIVTPDQLKEAQTKPDQAETKPDLDLSRPIPSPSKDSLTKEDTKAGFEKPSAAKAEPTAAKKEQKQETRQAALQPQPQLSPQPQVQPPQPQAQPPQQQAQPPQQQAQPPQQQALPPQPQAQPPQQQAQPPQQQAQPPQPQAQPPQAQQLPQQQQVQPQSPLPASQAPAPAPTPNALGYVPATPDVTVKYHVLLGLPPNLPPAQASSSGDKPGDGIDARDSEKADVASSAIAEFRRHLKTCSKRPASVAASDNVHVRLRVFMRPDGMLAAEPLLIEGTASMKALELKQSAVTALTTCQPYLMLPTDHYREWKVLDLSFTPDDFLS